MSKLFDALTRSLLEKYPADWLNQLGLIHGEPVRVMNSDLSSVTAEADKVIRVEGPSHRSAVPNRFASLFLRLRFTLTLAVSRNLLPNLPVGSMSAATQRWS